MLVLAVDWGNVPEWVGAVGTVFAFFAALGLLAWELHAGRAVATDRRRVEESRRREQASQVAAWIEQTPIDHEFVVVVKNASTYPVFEAAFYIAEADIRVEDSDWFLLGTVGPGVEKRTPYSSEGQSTRGVNLTMRDNAGVSWRRVGDGTLEEDSEPPTFC